MSYPTIHTRPLLRHEPPYNDLNVGQQRFLLRRLFLLAINCGLHFKVFRFDRRVTKTRSELEKAIRGELRSFVRNSYSLFADHDNTILYYDDGQTPLSNALTDILDGEIASLDHRHIVPTNYQQYRLAQIADLACCIELSEILYQEGRPTKSELIVFGSQNKFEKMYYMSFASMQI